MFTISRCIQSWNFKFQWLKEQRRAYNLLQVERLNQVELTQTKEEIRWSKIFYCTLLKNPKVIKPDLCHSWKDGAPLSMLHTENVILAINGMCRIKWNIAKIGQKMLKWCVFVCMFVYLHLCLGGGRVNHRNCLAPILRQLRFQVFK